MTRYNLTPDIIESIFKTYPAVKKKHLENVPSKLRSFVHEFCTFFYKFEEIKKNIFKFDLIFAR